MNDLLYFDYNQKSSVLLIFFVHAVVFSFLLLKKGIHENQNHSKWLALFILLGGLYICPFMCGYAGWYGQKSYREFLFFVPFQQLFLLGPVFFFYVKSLLNSNAKLTRKDFLHFVPALIYVLYSLVVFVTDKLILDAFYFYADGRDKDLAFWYQMAGLISMLFYLLLSIGHYRVYRKISLQEVSFADEIAFKWINHFAMVFSLILLLRVLFFILNPEWGQFGSKYWYYLCFSILLLYISITGYSNSVRATFKLDTSLMGAYDILGSNEEEEQEIDSRSDPDLDGWKEKIVQLIDTEEIYKDPSLTLSDIAKTLNTNRNTISKVINQEFNKNFNDFVNGRRVEAVIKKLKKGEHVHTTLIGIAMDCGFNSKTTFNRAFKKHTGLTPKQFISQNQH